MRVRVRVRVRVCARVCVYLSVLDHAVVSRRWPTVTLGWEYGVNVPITTCLSCHISVDLALYIVRLGLVR